MAWGNEFDKPPLPPQLSRGNYLNKADWEIGVKEYIDFTAIPANDTTFTIAHIERAKEYLNKVPTHDPYSNPDAHIYYQCNCGAVLDPGTKSFAALNNAAMNSGWKVRFGEEYYIPYCAECGKDVE